MKNKIRNTIKNIEEELKIIRRHLHKNPELSLKEYDTSKFVVETLKRFGIEEVYDDIYETAILAIIRGKESGKTLLLRADMDALPIIEETNLEFKSCNLGVMHACGHDAHITWMLGIAYVLNKLRHEFKGTVKIIFQPSEEKEGGARELLLKRNILLEDPKVDFAIAGHVWPDTNSGEFALVDGVAMGAAYKFKLLIKGIGGHGAEPHKTVDPISIANQIYIASQQIISRRISPFSNGVLTFGKFIADGAYNIIPSTSYIEGTIRGESFNQVEYIMNMFKKTVKNICKLNKAEFDLDVLMPIKEVVNDHNLVIKAHKILKDSDYKIDVLKYGAMTGEDFCYFSEKVPSLFFYVGTKNIEKNKIYHLHNSKFDIDEDILLNTVEAFSLLTIKIVDN